MDGQEKESLIKRISSGTLYSNIMFKYEEIDVIFNDPRLSLLNHACYIYNKSFEDLNSDEDLFTLEGSYKILRDQKIWTDKLEDEYNRLPEDIKKLNDLLPNLKFKKIQERQAVKTIKKLTNRLSELINIKRQLYSITIENLAEQAKRRFIIKNITVLQPEHQYLLDNYDFIQTLSVYYYRECNIAESKLREIARTDPWRTYWIFSKNNSSSLFGCSSVDMTELQKLLVTYSGYYDYIYEMDDRPSEEIIEDDVRLDLWFKSYTDNLAKERKNKNIDNGSSGKFNEETFVMADVEGAKDVFDLNSPMSKRIIKEREAALKKEGTIHESQLPDVRQKIDMLVKSK